MSDVSGRSDGNSPSWLRMAVAKMWVKCVAAVVVASSMAWIAALQWRVSPEQLLSQALVLESTDPRQALQLLETSIGASDGEHSKAQLVQCRVLARLRRREEALACFQRIERLNECSSDDVIALAHAAVAAGSPGLAELAFQAAGSAVYGMPASLRAFIDVTYELNHRAATVELCRAYANLVPDEPFPWLVSAAIHHENNNGTLAIEDYREAICRTLPESEAARVRYQLVGLLMERGDIQEARRHCDLLLAAAVDAASNDLVALQNAELLYREGRSEQSLASVNTVLAVHPDSRVALMIRGFLRYDAGEIPLAIDDLQAAVGKDPFNQRAHYKLGQALLRNHQQDAAEVHLKRSEELIQLSSEIMVAENLLGNTPGNHELQRRLADLNERRGNFKAAAGWRNRLHADHEHSAGQ